MIVDLNALHESLAWLIVALTLLIFVSVWQGTIKSWRKRGGLTFWTFGAYGGSIHRRK